MLASGAYLNNRACLIDGDQVYWSRAHGDRGEAANCVALDPLYIANEGNLVAIVAPEAADAVLAAVHAHPLGRLAGRIGHVAADPHRFVQMTTAFGGRRVVDWLSGEPLPRIKNFWIRWRTTRLIGGLNRLKRLQRPLE